MTFGELKTEFFARGYDYMDQDAAGRTRAARYLNEAYLEDICSDQPWDFLRTSTSGTAPLTVLDLDTIISIRNTVDDSRLDVVDQGWLADTHGDLSLSGTPEWAYFTGQTTLDVYPANTSATIDLDYYKIPEELDEDSDVPLVPSRWRGLIVDFAVVRALIDSDNYEAAQWLEGRAMRRLGRMESSELARSPHPGYVLPEGYW